MRHRHEHERGHDVLASLAPFEREPSIAIVEYDGPDMYAVEMVRGGQIAEGTRIPTSFMLPRERAQMLMDSLWDCGLRPSDGTGSAGALAATQRHLDDMRQLVFREPGTTKS